MQAIVYVFFFIFLIMLLILGLYFILSIVFVNNKDKKIKSLELEIYNLFIDFNENTSSNNKQFIVLNKLFNSKNGVEAFYKAYKRYREKYSLTNEFLALLDTVVDYEVILNNRFGKTIYSQSYALHLISEFKIDNEKIREFAIESLDSDSLYVRNNALRVLQNQTSVESILKALDKVNDYTKFYNYRIITDVLDNFKGSTIELDQELIKRIYVYNVQINAMIIDHFINTDQGLNPAVKEKFLECLETAKDQEITIRATRYFLKNYDLRAKPLIINNLNNYNWRIRAISVLAVSDYYDSNVKNKLIKRVQDVNFYVRKNSALTLIKHLSKEDLFNLTYNNPDAFATDTLVYAMESKNIKGYQQYKDKRMQIESKELANAS